MTKPYIGITGFTSEIEVKELVVACEKLGLRNDADYTAMFGFLCSSKRMRHPDEPGKQSPKFQDLRSLIAHAPSNLLPMVHYFTENKDTLADEVLQVFHNLYEDGTCRAVQLNHEWPDVAQVEYLKEQMPGLDIVLQIPPTVILSSNPWTISAQAAQYDELVSYVLIDPSGGFGKELRSDETADLFQLLRESVPHATIGIAGGLGAHNIADHIRSQRSKLPTHSSQYAFCVDAQGRLRTGDKRHIHLDLATAYLTQAASTLREQSD